MVALLVLLVLLLLPILWIVFMPLRLRINTDLQQYEVRQPGTLNISFHPRERPFMTMRVFGFSINTEKKAKPVQVPSAHKKQKRGVSRSPSAWRYLIRGIFKSVRLKRLVCTVDIDDVVMDAKLVPVMLLLNRGVVSVSTNSANRYFLLLEIEARLNKALWTFFRFYTKK